jgi:uncharacterized RDD family membrane protein YckC
MRIGAGEISNMEQEMEYVGFWARAVAAIIDLVLQLLITAPLTIAVYGRFVSPPGSMYMGPGDVLINVVVPAILVLGFWLWKGATPGKLAMSARIVDADTGAPMTSGQAVGRYLAYIVSALPLGIGFMWAGLDRRKQAWHDRLAGTVVIRPRGDEKVSFGQARAPAFEPTRPEPSL